MRLTKCPACGFKLDVDYNGFEIKDYERYVLDIEYYRCRYCKSSVSSMIRATLSKDRFVVNCYEDIYVSRSLSDSPITIQSMQRVVDNL